MNAIKDEDLHGRFIDDNFLISSKVLYRPLAVYFAYGNNNNDQGDCKSASIRCYLKLQKAGAIRVKGTRKYDRVNPFDNGSIARHYWVENKGLVFDESLGLQRIYKKEDYYRVAEIEDVEVSTAGFFLSEFDDEEHLLWANSLTDARKYQLIRLWEQDNHNEVVNQLFEISGYK